MTTQEQETQTQPPRPRTEARPRPDGSDEAKIQQVRQLYADAPEVGRVAAEHLLSAVQSEVAARTEGARTESAGRIGVRQGKVSELTLIAPFTAGGAQRLRSVLQLLEGDFRGAEAVGTLHDMRFVFLDDDTRLLF